jgi:CrcB protein
MTRSLLVAIGGFLGSLGRYWLTGIVQRVSAADFPIGTLVVNVLGSFVVAFVMILSVERGVIGANARLFLTIGVCGGFTTMSTFSYETLMLFRDGQTVFALVNIAGTVGASLAAAWLGQTVGSVL